MKLAQVTMCALVVALLTSVTARADMTVAPWATQDRSSISEPFVAGPAGESLSGAVEDLTCAAGDFDRSFSFPKLLEQAQGENRSSVGEAPVVPDSTVLIFCGLGSLGAFKLTRSVRKLHWDFSPAWYHDGGPRQIGYTFALELDLNGLPVWMADALVCRPTPVIAYRTGARFQRLIKPLPFLTCIGTRGPPLLPL